MKTILIFILTLVTSCSNFSEEKLVLKSEKNFYIQTEEAGTYEVIKESGFNKDDNFITKTSVASVENKSNFVEKTVTISKKTKLASGVDFLVPLKSEAIYVLDGKKYRSILDFDFKKDIISINMNTPEEHWNGHKTFSIPKNSGAICFYATVIECGIISTFIAKAIDNNGGEMSFMLVWEGYPFFQEQFLNVPSVPITDATLTFDGKNQNLYRFILTVAGQSQFYMVNKDGTVENHIWSSQAYSRMKR